MSLSKDDKNIEGLLLFFDNNTLNKSQINELGEVLNDFKTSKKPIYSYGAIMNNASLLLSSYSTESLMPPSASTSINVSGYSRNIPYFKTFTEKLGVDVNVIHVGDFKTYGENYTRSEMSEENRSDLKRVLDKDFSYFVEDISKNLTLKKNMVSSLILDGGLMGESSEILHKNSLITSLKYWEDFKKEKNISSITSIENYISTLIPSTAKNKIAIIYADGEINYSSTRNPKASTITPDRFIEVLEKASKDDSIKGIVVRVNSPGGSALASDIIYNSIKNSEKPIYVSVGSVAASGGYYISTGAKKIFANKNSITGSIGVVSLIPNFKTLSEKVGINVNEINSGKFSDLYSLTSPMTEDRKEKIYSANYKVYYEFLNRVAHGRNMSIESVDKIAQGKIWLGEEALNNGLIDSLGGLNTTIATLATDLEISDNYRIVEIAYEEDLFSILESTLLPIQKVLSLKALTNTENLKNLIETEEIFFKPILYLNF